MFYTVAHAMTQILVLLGTMMRLYMHTYTHIICVRMCIYIWYEGLLVGLQPVSPK